MWAQVAFYSGLGFILPASAVAGWLLGWALDRFLRTSPVLAIVMALLGAAGGFVEILTILKRAERRQSEDTSHGERGSS